MSQSNIISRAPHTPNKELVELSSLQPTPSYKLGGEIASNRQTKVLETSKIPSDKTYIVGVNPAEMTLKHLGSNSRYQRTAAFFKELSARPANGQAANDPHNMAKLSLKANEGISFPFEGFRFDSSQQNSRAGSQRASVIQQQAHLLSSSDMRLMKRRLHDETQKEHQNQRPSANKTSEGRFGMDTSASDNQANLPRDSSGGNSVEPIQIKPMPIYTLKRSPDEFVRQDSQSDNSVSIASPSFEYNNRVIQPKQRSDHRVMQKHIIGISRPDQTRSFHQPNKLIESLINRPPGSASTTAIRDSPMRMNSMVYEKKPEQKHRTIGSMESRPSSSHNQYSSSKTNPEVKIVDHFQTHHHPSKYPSELDQAGYLSEPQSIADDADPAAPDTLREAYLGNSVQNLKSELKQYDSTIIFSHKQHGTAPDTEYQLENMLLLAQISSIDTEIEEENRRLLELRDVMSDLRAAQEDQIHAKEKEASYLTKKYSKMKEILQRQLATELKGFTQICGALDKRQAD
jgi:hypothetical protein